MIVIVLATVAIAVAVVIMVIPPTSAEATGKRAHQPPPPPAPERMDTDPLPPPGAGNSNGADPWGGHSQIDPLPAPRPAPQITPPDPAPVDPSGPVDPFAPFDHKTPDLTTDFWFSALDHACQKLKTCPAVDQTAMATVCDTLSVLPKSQTTCATGKRCLDAIDRLSRVQTGSLADPASIVTMFQDCTTAATSC